jgi:signal transduction histidine kinase
LRLLVLTALFVMVAEVLIFAPSVGRFRLSYLQQRLADVHLALLAVEATPDGMVDMDLQARLLTHAGAISMTAWQSERPVLKLHPMTIPTPAKSFDLREGTFFSLIGDALTAIICTKERVIQVTGWSPANPHVLVQAVMAEQPMITEMRAYGGRILALSALISLITAALLYISLLWLLVRPLRRLSQAMADFRDSPQDEKRIITPSQRQDEVGVAERSLCEMQHRLRDALRQQARLAAVGQGVSKISHDLKGVLTTAILESDRLEMASADPEVRVVTQGIARALERAVSLASSTLRFATEGPLQPSMQAVALRAVIAEAVEGLKGETVFQLDVAQECQVWGDPEFLLRCFDNLLRNAVQAGARQVEVGTEERGAWVTVTLRDDGPGLPPKALENMFVPFSGSARAGGTGLGLPIAKELVEALGGDLRLTESGKGGAAFVCSLRAQAR